tara:strand:- start:803 stop:1879 length:1077 start_codon:yes stop_codon:yes gene_type:complete
MKLFREYTNYISKLKEQKSDILRDIEQLFEENTPVAKVGNNTKGVLHEILVGKHMLSSKHMKNHEGKTGETPTQMHDRLKKTMHPDDYKKINKRAKATAKHIKTHIESQGHTVHDVHWTSKPGDLHKSTGIHASQKQDASDVVVHSKDKNGRTTHHGISLKVTDNTSKHIGVSNPGSDAMYGGHHMITAHRESLEKQHPALKKSNATKRKAYVKSLSENERNKIRTQNTQALHKVSAHVHKHLENAGTHAIAEHIKTHVLQSHKTPMQEEGHHHLRVTTHSTTKTHQNKTGEEYGHHIVNPHEHYEHMLNDHQHLTAHHQGTSVVFKHKDKIIARHQMKFNSQSDTHSSLKGNGTPAV